MYKLLLVSDKAEVRALYEGFAEWENLGFERPAVAASAQEGIELLSHNRYDAVSSLLSVSEGKQFFAYLARRPELLGMETARDEARLRREISESRWGWNTPEWMQDAATDAGFVVSGTLLKKIGLQIPPLWPMQAIVLDMRAI